MHSNAKPNKCDQCDYATLDSDNLSNHMRVHSGEKPFLCDLCDYASSERKNLKRHMKVHNRTEDFHLKITDKAKQEEDHGLLITPDLNQQQCESEIFGTDQISEIHKEVEDKKLRMSQVQDELKVEKDEG